MSAVRETDKISESKRVLECALDYARLLIYLKLTPLLQSNFLALSMTKNGGKRALNLNF